VVFSGLEIVETSLEACLKSVKEVLGFLVMCPQVALDLMELLKTPLPSKESMVGVDPIKETLKGPERAGLRGLAPQLGVVLL
jgi:hypothetical protein